MKVDLSDQEWATILAALRYYDNHDQGEPSSRSDEIHELATAEAFEGQEVISLDSDGIVELEARIVNGLRWLRRV